MITTALIGILFLEPCILPRCLAQQDNKDKLIEQQKRVIEALQRTIKVMEHTIKERDAQIVETEAAYKKLPIIHTEIQANLRNRNEHLLEVVRELSRKYVDDIVLRKKLDLLNPPKEFVNGTIEKITDSLVQINLGTDHGLAKDQTLDVYRLQPESKYLGMIRILDVGQKNSVGRFVLPQGKTAGLALRIGDSVTSKLTSDGK
ncbi:MAG: hypothetical protein EXS16_18710 [Gemmataceae bacterium]|nr:hypothetical protein [Gemmataceae bacterium]